MNFFSDWNYKLPLLILCVSVSLSYFPLVCFGNYETGDTIVLEALLQDVDNSASSTQGYKKFPWLASIIKNGKIACAGALIDEIHILSSSYCLENISRDEISKLQIGIGYQSFGEHGNENNTFFRSEGPYYVRRVKKVIMDRGFHYEYVPMTHSIAILKMDSAIVVNDYVEPIRLMDNATIPKHRYQHPTPIKQAKLAGWRRGNGAAKPDVFLRGVTLRLYGFDECQKEFNTKKLNNIICANSPINNPCYYVQGSPLVTKLYGSTVLLGIREKDCSYPSVFTRVDFYLPWIRRNLYH